MTRVLLVLHGMGVHGADWFAGARGALDAAAGSYGLGGFADAVAAGGVAVAPVTYDDRFAAWLGRWGRDARALARFVRQNAVGVPANVVSWLETADATENNFLWSHVVDVLLYRYFAQVTTDVRVHVMRAVARAWGEALAADPGARVSLLAHSLGTSVAHDSLALLATDPPAGAEGFLAGDRRLSHVFMASNVSRILETLPRVYESAVAPPSVRGAGAYCAVYYDVRHDLDPFPAPRAFRPAWAAGRDFVPVRTRAVRDFNVHAIEHYLADPRVHVPLLRALFGFEAIDDATAARRAAEHDARPGPPCPQAVRDFADAARQRVRLVEDSPDVKALLTAGVSFLDGVRRAEGRCRQG